MLAMGAEVGAAAGDHDFPDGSFADEAGLAGALVDAMLELEESANSVGVDVVGDGRSTAADGVAEDFAQRPAQAFELAAGEAAGLAARPDAGAEEALVGIDVAHPGKQLLIEEGGFDGEAAAAKPLREIGCGDAQGFSAGRAESLDGAKVAKLQPAEAAGVDEAKLASADQGEACVGVRREGSVGGGYEQTAGHSQVHDPLASGRERFGGG